MKTETTFTVRAGVFGSLVLALGYLFSTGLSDDFRVWAFMILFAVCLVLMLNLLVDLFVLAFGLAAVFSGRGLGCVFKLVRKF